MADFYGQAGKNPFTLAGIGGILSTVTNAGNGVTQVYRQGALGTQQSLGTYNPSTGKFTKDINANLTDVELRALSSENGIKNIKNKSTEVVKKGKVQEGLSPESAEIQANQILSGNSASFLPNAEETQAALSQLQSGTVSGTRNTKDSFGNFKYPANLKSENQDVIRFTMLKYEPKQLSTTSGNISGFSERPTENRIRLGSVTLPIPGGISDTNSVSWGQDNMTPAQAALANLALTGITNGMEDAASRLGEMLESVKGNNDIKSAIALGFAEQATGVSGLLARTTGQIINPNMELLFNSPSLRPFGFTFKLSARGRDDREQIRQILRFFKQGMAVQRSQSQLFLKSPNTFQIQYLHRNEEHQYINRIKECALQSFTVNYTPEGNYMSFSDGLMTSYEISMQFQELEPIFNDDYTKIDNNNDSSIGY